MSTVANRVWRKPPLIPNPYIRWMVVLVSAVYLATTIGSLKINWTRLWEGLPRGGEFLLAFFSPDFQTRWFDISLGILESLTMTSISTVLGILISIPIAIGASKNMAPLPIYLVCRGIIALSRAFQEVIVAIFCVALFGFGPFAGVITLSFATIGFLAKLLAEDIEDINKDQLEAVRATGASWLQSLNYGVLPQVFPRLVGLSVYRLDINFRESAVIGIVGAGGIGATLNTSFDRYDFDSAAAILMIIIGIVLVAEYTSGYIRKGLV